MIPKAFAAKASLISAGALLMAAVVEASRGNVGFAIIYAGCMALSVVAATKIENEA